MQFALAASTLLLAAAFINAESLNAKTKGDWTGDEHAQIMMQTWEQSLDSSDAKSTPVTRVVNMLKEMQSTLQADMDQDSEMYKNLACWCNNNKHEKTENIAAAEAKIEDLKSTIDELTARSAQLKEDIAQLESDVAANKQALETATAMREKESKAFHGEEVEAIQNIENLKAAIMVLSRHHPGSALPQLSVSLLAVNSKDRSKRRFPWDSSHESGTERSLDDFVQQNFPTADDHVQQAPATNKFLQQDADDSSSDSVSSTATSWTALEQAVLRKALKSATVFAQSHSGQDLGDLYAPQSGQILGILKQLKDEMEANLGEAQKTEMAAAKSFEALRAAKTKEIRSGEEQGEQKEDQLAKAAMDLAEAKEDIEQTKASLSEEEQFMIKLKKTCDEGDANFDERKKARLAEMKAVSEAIEILTADEARDTFSATYSLLQMSSQTSDARRHQAAAVLRAASKRAHSPDLSILATRVQLDAFTRVKKAIDDMISMLKQQQEDEVKKNDFCNTEFQENDMDTKKAETAKSDLSARIDELDNQIKTLEDEVGAAGEQIAQLRVDLQKASEQRLQENRDYQQTVADQRVTVSVLKEALERLAKFYDASLIQSKSKGKTGQHKQTPPVQMEYTPNQGANGVMSMIEKLIYEAKDLEKESIASESASQQQYETVIAETNSLVSDLFQQIAAKQQQKAIAIKEKAEDESDLDDANAELEDLAKYNTQLHAECDYIVKNFSTRQTARSEEIEALQHAKQILSGAQMSS